MSFLKNLDRTTVWVLIVTLMLCTFPWHERSSTWGIVFLIGHYVADRNLLSKVKRFRWNPVVLISFLFFAWHFLGLLWSPYRDEGWKSIETKLSLLVLPFILSTENYLDRKNMKAIMSFFFVSCALAFGYDLFYSVYHYHALGPGIVFHRMKISEGLMHPGYFSNYFAFAILYLTYELWYSWRKPSWLYIFYLLLFMAVIVLMISKTVVLFILLLSIYFLWRLSAVVKNTGLRMVAFVFTLLLFGTGFYLLPPVKNKVKEVLSENYKDNHNPDYSHSTETRYIGYQNEWSLIQSKPITGYGTGAANPVFYERLKEKKFTNMLENNMHTHQQFFHTWLDLGLIGLLLLISLCVSLFHAFAAQHKAMGIWMTLLFLFTMLTDDALEIQAMGVFFIFLLNLLLCGKNFEKRIHPRF